MHGDGIMVTELQDGKNQETLIGDSFFDVFQARPMSEPRHDSDFTTTSLNS